MRALIPWNSHEELSTWNNDIDDFFNRFFFGRGLDSGEDDFTTSWLPALETASKNGEHLVRLDLPGVEAKDVKVSVEEDTLIIQGERKRSNEVKKNDCRYRETSCGKFERRVAIPKGVDGDMIKAKFKNGVLEVSLPDPKRTAARAITIEADNR